MEQAVSAQIEKLRAALSALEAQRATLGDVLDPAIVATRTKLAALEAQAAPSAPAEQRRLITILFTDIVGSTAMAEKLDPEEWRSKVVRLHETVGNLIVAHNGAIAQYLGDGLLAFFGAEESSEDDAENAIRAALDAQAAIGAWRQEMEPAPAGGENLRPSSPSLQVRIGIHTGLVVVGELGAESHRELTATGDAMNLAARLQAAAPPGGILISDETYHYVRGVFDVTPLPPLAVKGKNEPIRTFLVRRAKPRAFRTVTRGVTGIQTRTIGRDFELRQLQESYLEALENRRVVWVQLSGEPGVGKSRLVQETDDWIELRPETVRAFKARAFPGDENQPFALIRRLWFGRFQIAEDAALSLAEAKWMRGFSELWGENHNKLTERMHALGLLVGLPFHTSPYIGAMRNDPDQLKGRAYVVSREFFSRIRQTDPIELLLEDLQWADSSSLEYLRHVILEQEEEPPVELPLQGMFILAAARPDSRANSQLYGPANSPANPRVRHVEISLAPLSDPATRDLAYELLQNTEDVPPDAVELIVQRAEGIPYFAEEMVNYFLDRGVIDRTREPWRFVPARLNQAPLPATLQHLLLTRLGVLSDRERAALQRGAIFGRNFWTRGVEALGVPASAQLLGSLQPRGYVELLSESSFSDDTEWSFHQNLLREVTYETVLKRDRAPLHKAAARWLEERARQAGRLDEFAGLLAEHLERAGETLPAADWYTVAGERAKEQGATHEARRFFDFALQLLPPVEQERRWRALLGRQEVSSLLGERAAYQADVTGLVELAKELGDDERLTLALFHRSEFEERIGDYRTALATAEQALEGARRIGNPLLEVRVLSIMGLLQNRLGEHERACRGTEEALERARALSDDPILAEILGDVANSCGEAGDWQRQAELQCEAAEVAHRLGDRRREAIDLGNLGYAYVQLGLYKQCHAALEQALALNQGIGARRQRAYNLQNLGLTFTRLGDVRKARQLLDESIRELTTLGDSFGRAISIAYMAYAVELSGDFAAAALRYREAEETMLELGTEGYARDMSAGRARCAHALGQLDGARTLVNGLWSQLQEHGSGGLEKPVLAYLTCADLFDALGEPDQSRAAADAGHRELMERAAKFSNAEWRKSFLENVPEHCAMVELWERLKEPV